ncbi:MULTISPECIES: ParA family protein [Halobacillus]|uniref:ParA family protein n=1 Tax=Halobacillus TaxID=45667 RepID=UPI001117367E|nr:MULTISPECIES: AAA family ATPase [Halobacillus]
MGTVICINNNKGGSLKTTTATNLAGVLATEKKKVLIIDADNQSNVALTFGFNPDNDFEQGLYNVLLEETDPKEVIVKAHDYIDILPANDDLVGFDFGVIGDRDQYPEPFTIMKKTCAKLKNEYDYIFIDTPPSLSLMVGNAFTFADEVLIPYNPESYSMRSLIKVLQTIEDFKEQYNPDLNLLGVFATMVNYQTTLHQEVMQETRRYAIENGVKMFDTYIPSTIRFASSVAYDNLPATLGKNIQKANVYFELWKEINEDE